MPKRIVALPRTAGMEFDIVSYGRRGPGGSSGLTVEQIEQVKRTVSRVPEVMVKVSGGARDSGGAAAHLKYIGRHGKLEVETDDGRLLQGRGIANQVLADWQLDLCRGQYKPKPAEGERDRRAKLVHNIVLSMPAGTPPQKYYVLRAFSRERTSRSSIGMRWCCTRTRRIRTFISSSSANTSSNPEGGFLSARTRSDAGGSSSQP